MFIVLLITRLLVLGIQESAHSLNNAMVFIKVGVLTLFVVAGFIFLSSHTDLWAENWSDFIPDPKKDSEGKPILASSAGLEFSEGRA